MSQKKLYKDKKGHPSRIRDYLFDFLYVLPLENIGKSLGTERIVNKFNYISADLWFTY